MSRSTVSRLDRRHDMAGAQPVREAAEWQVAYSSTQVTWTLRGDAGIAILTANLVDKPGNLVVTDRAGQFLAPRDVVLHYGLPASDERPQPCPVLNPCYMHSTLSEAAWGLVARWASSGHNTGLLRAGVQGLYRTHLLSSMGRRAAS